MSSKVDSRGFVQDDDSACTSTDGIILKNVFAGKETRFYWKVLDLDTVFHNLTYLF